MEDHPQLVVRIDYFDLPDARETGRILDRLGILAERPIAPGQGQVPFSLVLESVEIGSWIAVLKPVFEIAVAGLTLAEHRDFVRAMLSQMIAALETLRQANVGQLPTAARYFFIELATPIRKRKASRVEIHLKGDNDISFVFEEADAELIQAVVTSIRPERMRTVDVAPALRLPRANAIAAVKGPVASPQRAVVPSLRYGQFPHGTAATGSLMFLEGKWVVRVDGSKGTVIDARKVPGWLDPGTAHSVRGVVLWTATSPRRPYMEIAPIRRFLGSK